jgi:hypothetical protein
MIYAVFPITVVLALIILLTLLPQATNVFEYSKGYIKRLNIEARGKLKIRILRALRPLGVQIGWFGFARMELKRATFCYVMDNAINALLSF